MLNTLKNQRSLSHQKQKIELYKNRMCKVYKYKCMTPRSIILRRVTLQYIARSQRPLLKTFEQTFKGTLS